MAKAAGAIFAFLAVFWTGGLVLVAAGRGPSVERAVVAGPASAAQTASAGTGDCPYAHPGRPARTTPLHEA